VKHRKEKNKIESVLDDEKEKRKNGVCFR